MTRKQRYPRVYSVRLDAETVEKLDELRQWCVQEPCLLKSKPVTKSDVLRSAVWALHEVLAILRGNR